MRRKDPLGPGILQGLEYFARLPQETWKAVTGRSALDNTGAICA